MLENDITVQIEYFLPTTRTRQGSLLLPPFCSTSYYTSSQEIGGGNYIKDNQIEKEKHKTSSMWDDIL